MLDQLEKTARIPIFETLEMESEEWFVRYKQFIDGRPEHILLDSTRGGRYSMFGIKSIANLYGRGSQLTITENGEEPKKQEGNLLDLMQLWMQQNVSSTDDRLPDFQGGAMGFFSYDIARQIENLPNLAEDDLHLPELSFVVYEDVGVYDHVEQTLWFISQVEKGKEQEGQKRLKTYKQEWTKPVNSSSTDLLIKSDENTSNIFQ